MFAPQVREAYLQFMVSIAKLTRDDRNLTQDDDRLWEEMMQVLELETDIANVSLDREGKGVFIMNRDNLKIQAAVEEAFFHLCCMLGHFASRGAPGCHCSLQ